jgi:hypothetical protein
MQRKLSLATLLAMVALWCVTAPASATNFVWNSGSWDNFSGSDLSLADTVNNTVEVGGLRFSDFRVVSSNGAPANDDIYIIGVNIAGDYGLKFTGGWHAFDDAILDTQIVFRVQVTNPTLYINHNLLRLGSYGTDQPDDPQIDPPAKVSVSENVTIFDPDGLVLPSVTNPIPIADKFVYYQSSTRKKLLDEEDFRISTVTAFEGTPPDEEQISNNDLADLVAYGSPAWELLGPMEPYTLIGSQSIWVSKNIIVTGGGEGGVGHLSAFYQTFAQGAPEPASLLLLTLGGLLIAKPRLRRRA